MSTQPTPQECNAGITRAALAVLNRLNRHNERCADNGTAPRQAAAPAPAPVRYIGDDTTEYPVIETPYRRLSYLVKPDGQFILRDASFVGTKCEIALIHLESEQILTLAKSLLATYHQRTEPEETESTR